MCRWVVKFIRSALKSSTYHSKWQEFYVIDEQSTCNRSRLKDRTFLHVRIVNSNNLKGNYPSSLTRKFSIVGDWSCDPRNFVYVKK